MVRKRAVNQLQPNDDDMKTEKQTPEERPKIVRWNPPDLPPLEFAFYTLFFIANIAYALYLCAQLTSKSRAQKNWDEYYSGPSSITGWNRDNRNHEWDLYLEVAVRYITLLAGNSVVLAVTDWLSSDVQRYIVIGYSIFAHLCLFNWFTVTWVTALGMLTIFITSKVRSKCVGWFIGLVTLSRVEDFMNRDDMIAGYNDLLFLTYTILNLISFCSSQSKRAANENESPNLTELFTRWLHFSLYLPYSFLLIVLYDDFESQWQQRRVVPREPILWTVVRAVRLVGCTLVLETVMSTMYASAFMTNADIAQSIHVYELMANCIVAGLIFYLKYVVIFGVPRVAAHQDNMRPPGPPCCVFRVNLYGRMWRSFDRGLYQFLKVEVYVPLIKGNYSPWRKLIGVLLCYSFVCLWHGFVTHNARWLLLNCIEVILEQVAIVLYSQPPVHEFIQSHIRPHTFRRIATFVQNICTSLGIFGIFNFLGEGKVGEIVAIRTWWAWGPSLQPLFFYLLFLGYTWNNMCLQLNRWCDQRKF